jgi:hypothetical protein
VEHAEATSGTSEARIFPQAAQPAQTQPDLAPEHSAAKSETPALPQAAAQADPKLEASKAAPARDIKLEVAGLDSRVEVRLTERGGDVLVAVRTADTNLADSLRDNLPTLSSRLADSGFKTDMWHPSPATAEVGRQSTQSAAGHAFQDADPQSRQQGQEQQDTGQRRPKSSQQVTQHKEKGRDFAWLMSTLR